MFWFFGLKACGILAPRPGIEPAPPALEGEVLTTGPPGKSPDILFNHIHLFPLKFLMKTLVISKKKRWIWSRIPRLKWAWQSQHSGQRTDFYVLLLWALSADSCFQVVSSQSSHLQLHVKQGLTEGLCDNKRVNLNEKDLYYKILKWQYFTIQFNNNINIIIIIYWIQITNGIQRILILISNIFLSMSWVKILSQGWLIESSPGSIQVRFLLSPAYPISSSLLLKATLFVVLQACTTSHFLLAESLFLLSARGLAQCSI